jgi:hypothetical protein
LGKGYRILGLSHLLLFLDEKKQKSRAAEKKAKNFYAS